MTISYPGPGGIPRGARPVLRGRREAVAAPERTGRVAHAGGADDHRHRCTGRRAGAACCRRVDRIRSAHPKRRPEVPADRPTRARAPGARRGRSEKCLSSRKVRGVPAGALRVEVGPGERKRSWSVWRRAEPAQVRPAARSSCGSECFGRGSRQWGCGQSKSSVRAPAYGAAHGGGTARRPHHRPTRPAAAVTAAKLRGGPTR